MNENKFAVVRDMLDAWTKLDWERVYHLFGKDGVLVNMMAEPAVGSDAIRERFVAFEQGLTRMEFIVLNMGMLGDDVVIERLDSFDFNGKTGLVPVAGVLTIADDGKFVIPTHGIVLDAIALFDSRDLKGVQGKNQLYASCAMDRDLTA